MWLLRKYPFRLGFECTLLCTTALDTLVVFRLLLFQIFRILFCPKRTKQQQSHTVQVTSPSLTHSTYRPHTNFTIRTRHTCSFNIKFIFRHSHFAKKFQVHECAWAKYVQDIGGTWMAGPNHYCYLLNLRKKTTTLFLVSNEKNVLRQKMYINGKYR